MKTLDWKMNKKLKSHLLRFDTEFLLLLISLIIFVFPVSFVCMCARVLIKLHLVKNDLSLCLMNNIIIFVIDGSLVKKSEKVNKLFMILLAEVKKGFLCFSVWSFEIGTFS